MANLWVRKPLNLLQAEAGDTEKGLKRTLGAPSLVALGIGAIIGAGLFVRTAAAAANCAGPSVTLGFVVAAVGCAFAGLCYAELASMIPIAGSAYTYSYATMGELVAWIIGWDLVLEYALGAATVGIAWSEYLNKLLGLFGASIPYAFCHSPFQIDEATGAHGIINIPALGIVLLLTLLLIRGMQESAFVNALIVVMKVTDRHPHHHARLGLHRAREPHAVHPGAERVHGQAGGRARLRRRHGDPRRGRDRLLRVHRLRRRLDRRAGGEEPEARHADRHPRLARRSARCSTSSSPTSSPGSRRSSSSATPGSEASVAKAIDAFMPGYKWLSNAVTVAILGGFSSVILVMLMGQSRVFYSMSRDGLVPAAFSDVHPRYRTPYKSNLALLRVRRALRGVRPGRHRRRHDEHRDAVRVHPRVDRRVGDAGEGAGRDSGSSASRWCRWSRSSGCSSAAR